MDKEGRRIFGVDRNVFLLDVLGVGKVAGGSLMGIVESVSSLFKVFFGYLSDRFRKRKLFVALGYLISTVSKGALAFTQSWCDFLTLRITERAGKGIRTAQ